VKVLKNTEGSKELIRKDNTAKKLSLDVIEKIKLNSKKAKLVLVTSIETKEI
jgi:hypothetical protein